MILLVLSVAALVCALVPAALFWSNLRLYRPPRHAAGAALPAVSVLIPARDEERSIGAAVGAALRSESAEIEVVVLDDGSADATADVVRRLQSADGRVRLIGGVGLPAGWCGKQHACWVLAGHAKHDLLLFVDADVRLKPCAVAALVDFLASSNAALVSGFPRQETGTAAERLVIPLIHFVLLGFLPLGRMRASCLPAYGAGCGQLMLARKSAYLESGGHAAIRDTLHDGIRLPRVLRTAGFRTDLCDASGIASCRMYRGLGEVWRGLAKNATEGLGTPRLILFTTLLLLFGQVLPLVLVALSFAWASPALLPAVAATVCSYYPRLAGAVRFRESVIGALLHPLGVALLLAIQWYAFFSRWLGRPAAWKGRAYAAAQTHQA